jgi:hypothetical protein
MKIIKCVIKIDGMYVGKNMEYFVNNIEDAHVFHGKRLTKKYIKMLKGIKVEIQEI